jgi:hypothetical protein
MAWLTTPSIWNRRKPKLVRGSTAGAQTNYQLKLTIYKGAGTDTDNTIYLGTYVNNDFSDLRFTSLDETTLLPYWIESYISGVSAIVWVKIDSIPADPFTKFIYIYYNNPIASPGSYGNNTFAFFDEFNDLNNWTTDISPNYGESLSTSIDTGILTVSTNVSNSDPNGSYAIKKSIQSFSPNVAIMTRYRDNGSSWYPGGFGFGIYKLPATTFVKQWNHIYFLLLYL